MSNGLKVSPFSCSPHVESQRFQPLSSVSQQLPTRRGGETTGCFPLMPRDLSCDLSSPITGRVEGRCLKMKRGFCLPSRHFKAAGASLFSHHGPPRFSRGGSQSHSLHSYWWKARRGRVQSMAVGLATVVASAKTFCWPDDRQADTGMQETGNCR